MKALVVTIAGLTLSATAASAGAPHVGVTADVGAPDGAISSLVVRPVRFLELQGGIGYNLISTGFRAGLTLVPFAGVFTPTLSVDYGHYPEGDANQLVQMFDPSLSSSLLDHVGYDYMNAHVGIALGGARAKFFLRAGASRINTTEVQDTRTVTSMDAGEVTVASTARVSAWTVSGRIGFVIYLH